MSSWVHINGLVEVSVIGRTQPEIQYVLDTVLNHLPNVHGSETNLKVHAIKRSGFKSSRNHDEFGNPIVTDSWDDAWIETQSNYFLVLEANLRDANFETSYRELQNYLCRLAKRIRIEYVLIDIWGHTMSWTQNHARIDNAKVYKSMWERPSWADENSKNWCEYLIWNPTDIPECYK